MEDDKIRNAIWEACQRVLPHEQYDLRFQTVSIGCKDATVITITCIEKEIRRR